MFNNDLIDELESILVSIEHLLMDDFILSDEVKISMSQSAIRGLLNMIDEERLGKSSSK